MSATGDPQAASLKVGCGLDASLAIVFAPRGAIPTDQISDSHPSTEA